MMEKIVAMDYVTELNLNNVRYLLDYIVDIYYNSMHWVLSKNFMMVVRVVNVLHEQR